jgi:RNA polymerase sigma-70 factor, ECF subfamily
MKDVRVPEARQDDIEQVYREHGARLWRAVYAFAGDREVASDSVAEAFMQALRRGPELRSPLPWIWRAAFRIAAGELKDRRRRPAADPAVSDEPPESLADVLAALRRLSPKQRAAVVLHEYMGYPVREVAAIVGSTAGAVRVHLSVGRKRLRDLLEEDDDG